MRDRSRLSAEFKNLVSKLQQSMFFSCTAGDTVCHLVFGPFSSVLADFDFTICEHNFA